MEEKEANWEEGSSDIDLTEDDYDEIDWNKVHLTKAQFKDFLNEMRDNPMEVDEEDELDVKIEVLDLDFNGEDIEFTVTSVEEDNFAEEFAQTMYIYMLDGFSRQFYLNSDYSDGNQHPTITFYGEEGTLITENDDFIEMEKE